MAVTVEKRPIGVVLDSGVSATINSDYSSAFATVNKTAHGLSDGDYVYIKSNVENYNGFWQIDVRNADEFLLIDNPYVAWIVDASITYYPQVTTHGWQCVHLPIVYELSNTRYPVNSVDTVRTISSISDDHGYVNFNLSGSLGTFEDLAFVKISNAANSDFNGVYQILDKLASNDVTINLNYSSTPASGIVGASIQLYYSNYNFVVRVYAGLNSSHEWADQKPYELAATLEIIPDENNRARFSINEILKSYVELKNNLTLATLPNNIDAFTQFYIEVAEQYDISNGYTITTQRSGYASDQSVFEGYAVNAKLPFKNVHSGYLSEYIMTNTTAKFLTLFTIPVIFACSDDAPDCYNDVSILIRHELTSLKVKEQYYSNDVLQTTVTTEEENAYDAGVYRVPLSEADCSYDRVDVTLLGSYQEEGDYNYFNEIDNSGESWSTETNVNLGFSLKSDIDNTIKFTKIVYVPFNAPAGTYNVGGSQYVDVIGGTPDAVVRFYLIGTDLTILDTSADYAITNETIENNNEDLTANSEVRYIGMMFQMTANASAFVNGTLIATATDQIISETKQFKIDCGCANQEIRLMWLNYLGGFDQWKFTGETGHAVDITNSGETKENIFPQWPNSYGEFADTIRKQTFIESANRKFVYSQFLTQDEADAISHIKSSPLVQIVNSRTDRRTVIVDKESFTKYSDGDKTYRIEFSILYTDDIPSQTV